MSESTCCQKGDRGLMGLQGPKGDNGLVGPQGLQGPQGIQGPQGLTGLTGPAGTNGTNGAVGPAGPAGAAGIPGATGPAGANGTNGTNGTNGADGAVGPAGPQGDPGPAGAIVWTMAHNANYLLGDSIDQKIVIIRPDALSAPGTLTSFALPVAAVPLILGRTFYFIGAETAGTFKIIAPIGVIIKIGNLATTAGGTITFDGGDSVEIVYVMDVIYAEVWVISDHFNPTGTAPIIT